jgi:large subunit ribosomal protein L15
MQVVNLSKITGWIAQGRLDPLKPITIRELAISKCVSNIKEGVKLLAHGSEAVRYPIDIVVSRASGAAIAAIEEAGGSVLTRYYTPLAVRRIIGGTMDPVVSLWSAKRSVDGAAEASADKSVGFRYRLPDPTSRKDIEYYRDPAHRGYLSHTVAPGEGPSLFFRAPGTGIDRKRLRVAGPGKSKAESVENRLW